MVRTCLRLAYASGYLHANLSPRLNYWGTNFAFTNGATTNLQNAMRYVMQILIQEREQLPDAYRRPVGPGVNSRIALRMMSVVSARPSEFPRTASVWRFLNSYSTLDFTVVGFSSSELSSPSLNSADYAVQLGEAGLIQTRDVPAWVLAEIALSL
jgi:hypothetical protein